MELIPFLGITLDTSEFVLNDNDISKALIANKILQELFTTIPDTYLDYDNADFDTSLELTSKKVLDLPPNFEFKP